MTKGRWSDCAVYNEPAYPKGPGNCGGLDLAAYDAYCRVSSFIPSPRSLAVCVRDGVGPSLIEAEKSEFRLEAGLSTVNLPSPHDGVPSGRSSNSVDFHNA